MTLFTEEQLESLIFDNKDKVHEKGLPKFYKHTIRQFILPSKKIIDLFTFEVRDDVLYFRIIELKRDMIFNDSFMQILGYYSTVMRCLGKSFLSVRFDLVLVGYEINSSCSVLSDLMKDYLSVYMYNFDYTGMSFVKHIHDMTDWKEEDSFSNFILSPIIDKNGAVCNSITERDEINALINLVK